LPAVFLIFMVNPALKDCCLEGRSWQWFESTSHLCRSDAIITSGISIPFTCSYFSLLENALQDIIWKYIYW